MSTPKVGDVVYFKATVVGVGSIFGEESVRVRFEGQPPNMWQAIPAKGVANISELINEGRDDGRSEV